MNSGGKRRGNKRPWEGGKKKREEKRREGKKGTREGNPLSLAPSHCLSLKLLVVYTIINIYLGVSKKKNCRYAQDSLAQNTRLTRTTYTYTYTYIYENGTRDQYHNLSPQNNRVPEWNRGLFLLPLMIVIQTIHAVQEQQLPYSQNNVHITSQASQYKSCVLKQV